MIDLKLARKEPEIIANALRARNSALDINEFLQFDENRRKLLAEVEALKNERNQASAEVAKMKREGIDASHLFSDLARLSENISQLDAKAALASEEVERWLMSVPNIPHSSVPLGNDEADNLVLAEYGKKPLFDFPVKAHDELGTFLGGIDFERASKLAGSRFAVLKGWAARLDRALVNFFLDQHTQNENYIEVIPPVLVNRKTMTGTGQLPKFEDDLFRVDQWDYFLIPTAEVPLTNLYADDAIPEELLPLAFCAATPCFRAEAGAAGRDTRGLIRMHQFTKVEMVRFSLPDDSYNQLELMKDQAARLLELLELPYRIISLCTGDLGFSAAKTYDLEVWLPAQKTYREISSCSNCGDFQARRANIRFRPKNGKPQFVHTLNGSGLPTGRSMAAILENGQRKDGSIVLPKVLVPYMNGLEVIEPVR